MHRVLLPFEFFEPTSVDEVVAIADGQKAKVLAGGVDLVLKMRLRKVLPEKVVSIQKIPGLDFVNSGQDNELKIGALASLRKIEQAAMVQENWVVLYEAINSIATVQTKTMGTAVGNLCAATPGSDVSPALFALGAKLKVAGINGEREINIEDFFLDVGKTSLKSNEIVTEILVPNAQPGTGGAFMKLTQGEEGCAKVNAAVSVTVASGKFESVRISIGSCAPTTLRSYEAEELLKGRSVNEESISLAAAAAADSTSPISDVRSTADYRKKMVNLLVHDGLKKALDRAQA